MASYQNAKKVSGGYEVQIPDYTKPTGMFGFQMTTQFIPDSAVGNVETRSRPMGYGMYDTTYDLSGVDIPEPETAPPASTTFEAVSVPCPPVIDT